MPLRRIRVATGGCFALGVHPGHCALLAYLRELAGPVGEVEVYINSDESLVRLKGKGKLIYSQEQRVSLLAAIRFVDNVFIFASDTPCGIIMNRQPDVWVKSLGWGSVADLEETSIIERYGGRVEVWESPVNISTTQIIKQIRAV